MKPERPNLNISCNRIKKWCGFSEIKKTVPYSIECVFGFLWTGQCAYRSLLSVNVLLSYDL